MNLINDITPKIIIMPLIRLNTIKVSKGSGVKIENKSDKKKLIPTSKPIK